MHLIEAYASSSRLKISSPEILEKFFPLSFDNYCCLHTVGGMPAKYYDYFGEVIQLISPFLNNLKLNIIHLGGKDDPVIPNVIRLCGQTDIHQSAYILKRAKLHIGVDSCLLHIASSYDIPIVGIFGLAPPENCGPFWGTKSKQICLTPEFKEGNTYSYNPNEGPDKTVNTIKPETVANSVLKLLGISQTIPLQTLHIGTSYKQNIIELISNCLISPENFPGQLINIRADLLFNEEIIYQQVSIRKSTIVTNRALNLEVLKQLKNNIEQIIIELKDDSLFEFVKILHKSPIKYALVSYADDSALNDLKFKYLDFNQIVPLTRTKKSDILTEINENTFFATNKALISEGKIYPSEAHWRANKPAEQENKVIDSSEFWSESEYIYLFNK